jgi:hypothetical protein
VRSGPSIVSPRQFRPQPDLDQAADGVAEVFQPAVTSIEPAMCAERSTYRPDAVMVS